MMITDEIAEERPSAPRLEQRQSGFTEVRARVTDLERHARTLVRQRPIVAVLVAVSVGYLTGRLVFRAMR